MKFAHRITVGYLALSVVSRRVAAFFELPVNKDLPQVSRQACENELHGIVVGDIGNGAIFRDNYLCESNGERPIGVIVATQEDESIAIEGEVCCGAATNEGGLSVDPTASEPMDLPNNNDGTNGSTAPPSTTVAFLETHVSRQECVAQGGQVVGDAGNGAIFQADYRCKSNGEPPHAVVVPAEGEPIATEGEVL